MLTSFPSLLSLTHSFTDPCKSCVYLCLCRTEACLCVQEATEAGALAISWKKKAYEAVQKVLFSAARAVSRSYAMPCGAMCCAGLGCAVPCCAVLLPLCLVVSALLHYAKSLSSILPLHSSHMLYCSGCFMTLADDC